MTVSACVLISLARATDEMSVSEEIVLTLCHENLKADFIGPCVNVSLASIMFPRSIIVFEKALPWE